jgi:hypothetical protein
MHAAATELANLRAALAELVEWAEDNLAIDYRDRQLIAEYLTDAIDALASGDTPPVAPF